MNRQFHDKKPILSEDINRINKNNKKQLNQLIKSLIKRRQTHQATIQRLVTKSNPSKDLTKQSIKDSQSEFQKILDQFDINQEPIMVNQGHESSGAFEGHVNLLATVSLKTDYHLCEQIISRQPGQLYASLKKKFKSDKLVKSLENTEEPKNMPQFMKQIAAYLVQQQLSDDIFTHNSQHSTLQFFGTVFKLGKFDEIHLSKDPLSSDEQRLVISEDNSSNVGWLLLQRLLASPNIKSFPQALHTLFSYPIKVFNIKSSLQLIQFNEFLGQVSKNEQEDSPIKIYGFDEQQGASFEISNISKAKIIKHYKSIVNRFDKIFIINKEQLPVKHIPLSCLQNHFVIVTMTVTYRAEYFLSVGQDNQNKSYRVYILNNDGELVQSEIVKDGNFITCKLKPEEYDVYISPIVVNEQIANNCEQSYELVQESQQHFNLWVQGKHIYSKNCQLDLEIRLKEQYNIYTSKIVNSYKAESKKQMADEPPIQPRKVMIKRQIIECLNLVVDTFVLPFTTPAEITYKGRHMLCDKLFQENSATVKNGQSLILYSKANIDTVSTEINGVKEVFEVKVVEFFV